MVLLLYISVSCFHPVKLSYFPYPKSFELSRLALFGYSLKTFVVLPSHLVYLLRIITTNCFLETFSSWYHFDFSFSNSISVWHLSRIYMHWCNARQIFLLLIVTSVCDWAQVNTRNAVVRSKEVMLRSRAVSSARICIHSLTLLVILQRLLLLRTLLWLCHNLQVIRPTRPKMVSLPAEKAMIVRRI